MNKNNIFVVFWPHSARVPYDVHPVFELCLEKNDSNSWDQTYFCYIVKCYWISVLTGNSIPNIYLFTAYQISQNDAIFAGRCCEIVSCQNLVKLVKAGNQTVNKQAYSSLNSSICCHNIFIPLVWLK